MKKLYTLLVLFIISTVLVNAQKLPFQGYLEESGVPVEGTRDFTFSLSAYSWAETFSAVPVTNGVYNVVLGSNNPLPANLFDNVDETPLEISVNATSIGTVTLYRPLISSASLLTSDGNLEIKGPNDSLNLRIGSFNPYYGSVNLFDSLGAQQGFLSADPSGGRLQLNQRDDAGNLSSAVVIRSFNTTSSLNLFGQNTAANSVTRMISNYVSGNEIDLGPPMSGNYKRSGTDWFDNEGTLLAAIGNAREEASAPGSSGFLSLWGSNSFNAQLTGTRWANNDLPILQLFGSNDNGAGFWQPNINLEVNPGAGTDNNGNIMLLNTDDAGVTSDGLFLTSNLNASGGGGIEVKNNTAANTIILDGQSGNIASTRASDGGAAVSIFQNSESGGIAIQNAADENNLFYDAELNVLELKSAGTPTITLDGTNHVVEVLSSGSPTITMDGIAGTIDVTGDLRVGGTSTVNSDRRLKKDIQTLSNALDNVTKLRGTYYYWKDSKKTTRRQVGVIAQEVEKVYPELVKTNDDGIKSVNYAQMTAVLIEAVKELNAKIENLESDNKELTTALNEQQKLNDRITKLEKLLLENTKVATND